MYTTDRHVGRAPLSVGIATRSAKPTTPHAALHQLQCLAFSRHRQVTSNGQLHYTSIGRATPLRPAQRSMNIHDAAAYRG